ncbi:M56 family metallopeptidase [Flavobacterium gawalongense]|uniref:M56 family metallopeptidase n=1 Tax=Flavobacterium gawalongense TaxID=2594432 RepID=A0A553BIV0_9FLAO|nr:M56 family metallopeptidase [Flavobacterium gawalongense]TRX00080.1 M56 family metallopeptidase [Flavobacterium gawalongense]TRX04827.1 M56 family metallopeptidase [Flavobacterium gawalongense]TRX08178.1 M56 family metallopeptidase [Flavobacterium gawalongense]TRX08752.1 M56 family metallopeptidase [Flavobacterium gawalongense]TRX24680.1 M56 family metallopeptidase [Flavobacterium gawalongense]
METVFIYLIKSSGLIGMFYLAYYFMLRKETFFTSNRRFLLAGLIASVVLPFVFITKIIWVEPTTTPINWPSIPVTNYTEEKTFEDYLPMLTALAYGLGVLLLLAKFAFDFYSLNVVLKGKSIQQQADFKFIDVIENVAPFSYFNTIVYNSALYTPSELENILEHEKVHSEQNHTVDVLISRLFCIVFWFNPFIWWYKKAILQNLEFIADNEASKKISDKKAYQITLLKITTHKNCVAITNHFYQSLIKKRIVMLNKNQSKKRNSWKYALVLPALVAFVFLFQIKTIAQEKIAEIQEIENKKTDPNTVDVYKINKNTTDKELDKKASIIKNNYGITATFSKVKRNSDDELIAITVELKKGKEISEIMKTQGNEAIKTFGIVVSKNAKGILAIDFAAEDKMNNGMNTKIGIVSPDEPMTMKEIFINGAKGSQNDMDKLDPDEIESMDVIKKSNKQEIRIITNKHGKMLDENDIYINGEKVTKNELALLDQNTIDKMDVDKREKTIKIVTKTNAQTFNHKDIPTPPTPPKFPEGPMPVPPIPDMSKLPAPPAHPSNVKDKKAMAEFEKKMKEFEKKMESFEPDMTAYEKEVEEVMAKREKIFKKEMAKYEDAMEKYRDAMEKRND